MAKAKEQNIKDRLVPSLDGLMAKRHRVKEAFEPSLEDKCINATNLKHRLRVIFVLVHLLEMMFGNPQTEEGEDDKVDKGDPEER